MAALSREDLLRLARAGASARVKELEAELQSIYRAFPDLKSGGRTRTAANGATKTAGAPTTRKRTWSAADKKAVSERMKKYWAARKAAAAKGSKARARLT
jgi:hypothetical protein